MGVVITSAMHEVLHGAVAIDQLWDPVLVLSHITSPVAPPGLETPIIADGATRMIVAVIALVGVAVATISVNIAANVVSPANDFANLAPRHISFKAGGVITGVLGILMMPWKLMASADAYIFNWLVGYSALLGPVAGIMICDYFVLRDKTLDVPDLYRTEGRYPKWNPVAIVALVLGVLPNVPGFLHSTHVVEAEPGFFDDLYVYAWFTGFLLAFGVYWLGSKLAVTPPRQRA
jgi:NCS1 family nucleobase:cation symporter-1